MKHHRIIALLICLPSYAGLTYAQSAHDVTKAQAGPAAVQGAEPPAAAEPSAAHNSSFIIGNDDVLAVNVWKEAELSQSVQVRSDGKISLPLVHDVQAAGKTPLQLEQDIAFKLRAYITEPDVTVIVTKINSQKFNILGKVTKPGEYPLNAVTTVLDGIAMAGGFQDFAREKSIYILRQRPGGGQIRIPFNYKDVIKGKNPDQNIKLEPHDTIFVP